MAGDWIKWVKGLTRRTEVIQIAAGLKLDRRLVAAVCMEFWEWVDDSTTDGNLPGCNSETVDSVVCVPGFGSAMVRVGWLIETPNGMAVAHFDRHNSASSKARALNALRQSKYRERDHRNGTPSRERYESNAPTVTREEKRREEKKQQQQQCTPDAKPNDPKPAAAAAGAFRQWAETQARRPEWLPTGKGWITADEWESVGIAGAGLISEGEYAAIVREAKDSRHSLKNPAGFILRKLRTLAKGRKGTE